ncbi:mitogen activated protein kinase kinase kinase [Trichuris trichiura]|uniref:Mitogen activated protein kinase kinase kinase n=1 Tax=Trichuris trichiura TaxID=36087 RepID=A0A077ZM48_TRITR|nr:mitogen activated protein kinase kinase kinase [Trichuris trichiura]
MSCEVINQKELVLISRVGRGGYGTVYRARWRGIDVAVKYFQTYEEKKSLKAEIDQLSRVSHENIVRLHGICVDERGPTCLVTEYAECGCLYYRTSRNSLSPVEYTKTHALHWALQCAKGVSYLHAMEPKPIVHRDLKTPNLLLCRHGTLLKICDFGTACDLQSIMTNNKGSAAWMAPEVFEGWLSKYDKCNALCDGGNSLGSKYDEKCDVYSWGIILWELLARRIPFEEMAKSAYQIMWAVHNKERPPDIDDCPIELSKLMKRCWDANPLVRPAMFDVVDVVLSFVKTSSGTAFPEPLNFDKPPSIIDEPVSYANFITGASVDPIQEAPALIAGMNYPIEEDRTVEMFPTLERHLQPVLPIPGHDESVALYEGHVALCQRLIGLRKQLETILEQRDITLSHFSLQSADTISEENIYSRIWQLSEEKRSLIALKESLLQQIAQFRSSPES